MESFAGTILLLLAAIVLLQYAQGGWDNHHGKGVKPWLQAKFLGQAS